MRRTRLTTALALLVLAGCGDRPADTAGEAALPAEAVALGLDTISASRPGPEAKRIEHPPLLVSKADPTLPRNPFTVIRTAAELQRMWRLAGAPGSPPPVDFGRAVVMAVRLPATADPAALAPATYSVEQGTHVILKRGTPNEIGGEPTDRMHFYTVPVTAGPLASVGYQGAE